MSRLQQELYKWDTLDNLERLRIVASLLDLGSCIRYFKSRAFQLSLSAADRGMSNSLVESQD